MEEEEVIEPVSPAIMLINHKGYSIPCRIVRLDSTTTDPKNTLLSLGFSTRWGVFLTRSSYGRTAIQPVFLVDWMEMKGSFKKWNDYTLDYWSWRKKGEA